MHKLSDSFSAAPGTREPTPRLPVGLQRPPALPQRALDEPSALVSSVERDSYSQSNGIDLSGEAISNHIAKEGHGFFSISNEYQTISNQYQNRYRSVLLDCG